MNDVMARFRKNRTLIITLAILAMLFFIAIRGMSTKDWVITTLRGLSVGAVTFVVAAGFSIIFGLMDVLNLAHGTLFMIGAYVGWTVYVRPDTAVDIFAFCTGRGRAAPHAPLALHPGAAQGSQQSG
jgi:branched-chain amino acid transport system permease protein